MAAGEMDVEAMMAVFFVILLSTMDVADAQMAFPHVAKGQRAVARLFRGAFPFRLALTARCIERLPPTSLFRFCVGLYSQGAL